MVAVATQKNDNKTETLAALENTGIHSVKKKLWAQAAGPLIAPCAWAPVTALLLLCFADFVGTPVAPDQRTRPLTDRLADSWHTPPAPLLCPIWSA